MQKTSDSLKVDKMSIGPARILPSEMPGSRKKKAGLRLHEEKREYKRGRAYFSRVKRSAVDEE